MPAPERRTVPVRRELAETIELVAAEDECSSFVAECFEVPRVGPAPRDRRKASDDAIDDVVALANNLRAAEPPVEAIGVARVVVVATIPAVTDVVDAKRADGTRTLPVAELQEHTEVPLRAFQSFYGHPVTLGTG